MVQSEIEKRADQVLLTLENLIEELSKEYIVEKSKTLELEALREGVDVLEQLVGLEEEIHHIVG